MGLFDHFPYTNFHELNLTWILETMKALQAEVDELMAWMGTHKEEYQEALARLEHVENEIDSFEQQVEAQFEALSAQLQQEFADQKAEMERILSETTQQLEQELADTKAQINAEMQLLEEEVNAAIASFENRFLALETEVNRNLRKLKQK